MQVMKWLMPRKRLKMIILMKKDGWMWMWMYASQPVVGYQPNVESKKDKKLLILFPHTIVDPRAVVIHLLDASAEENIKHQDRNNGTYLWQTEQW